MAFVSELRRRCEVVEDTLRAASGRHILVEIDLEERTGGDRNGELPTDEPEGERAYAPPRSDSGSASPSWPDPLEDAALRGLPGEYVKLVGPHTEADPVALVADFLVSFGSVIGRRAHWTAEGDRHHGNLFAVLVGRTSKARKGTSHGRVASLFGAVDPDWASKCEISGLSSGEGLIQTVHDGIEKREPQKVKGTISGYQTVVVEPGVTDKRAFVYEPEFASVLRIVGRDGNTLSAVVRNAWDTGNLRTLTRNSPLRATVAHISILGHITKDELLHYLDRTEIGNGFANRFIWLCVKRSRVLPEGGALEGVNLSPIVKGLTEAVAFARGRDLLVRDEEARALWAERYHALSEGRPGRLGAVTGRAEAQTMRLAMLYALLGRSARIRRSDLESALAVWRYSFDSARFLFGDALGDPDADAILRALRGAPGGLTRTKIRDLFGRNRKEEQIQRALDVLLEHGLVVKEIEETGGRPAERWRMVAGL